MLLLNVRIFHVFVYLDFRQSLFEDISKIKSSFFSLFIAYISISTNTHQLTLLPVICYIELTGDQPPMLQQRRDLEAWKPQVKRILSYLFYTCLSSVLLQGITCFITSNKGLKYMRHLSIKLDI